MPELKNFVSVDWRNGKDCIYFIFKNSNTYARFDLGANQVPESYPTAITQKTWGSFHEHMKNLRFGFHTDGLMIYQNETYSQTGITLWLFYDVEGKPMVCQYSQTADEPQSYTELADSVWSSLTPFYDQIVAGTWWDEVDASEFRFLLKDGNFLTLNINPEVKSGLEIGGEFASRPEKKWTVITGSEATAHPINDSTWPGIAPYKDRIITAAQNDRLFADNYLYIFLTNNEYITYNIPANRIEHGPSKVTNDNWPGLLRD